LVEDLLRLPLFFQQPGGFFAGHLAGFLAD
jgi:hypothetical protein